MTLHPVKLLSDVWFCEFAHSATGHRELVAAFEREQAAPDLKRTHHFHGRFENTYIPVERIPEIRPILDFATACAKRILDAPALRHGYWFNAMPPGHRTSLHSHEELDEQLSAVYYLTCPENSGCLVLHDDEAKILIKPRPGLLVLFPPNLPHEVEVNQSDATRLSVAFNFGPGAPAT